MEKAKKLPKKIVDDLNRNTMFNMFGMVNISALRSRTGTKLRDNDLKQRIRSHFRNDMVTGEVEFMDKK